MTGTGGQNGPRPEGGPDPEGDGRTVTYVFPIEVIVVGALSEEDHRAVEERIWSRFAEALAQLP